MKNSDEIEQFVLYMSERNICFAHEVLWYFMQNLHKGEEIPVK